ncbi:hypothetical protein ABC440_11690 [Brucella melitensis]
MELIRPEGERNAAEGEDRGLRDGAQSGGGRYLSRAARGDHTVTVWRISPLLRIRAIKTGEGQ